MDPNLLLPDEALPSSLSFGMSEEVLYKGKPTESAFSDDNESIEKPNSSAEEEKIREVKEPDTHAVDELKDTLVILQAEDYGGGIALPHYGYRKPSADYFNSNLMTYNFVIADITIGENSVLLYDERHQGKGGDALCSLRLRYHLRKWQSYSTRKQIPKLCMILLDNCVGQNKSQVVLKFMCLLSILFYDTVALMFFMPGHTHMVADRLLANCKNSIKNLNLFTVGQITQEFDRVQRINAEWLRPNDFDKPFRIQWESALSKYFRDMPTGYTGNYFFEFSKGYCTFRRLATTPDAEAVSIQLTKKIPELRKQILEDLFMETNLMKVRMIDLRLPQHAGKSLSMKKIKSLGKKYFSIPDKYYQSKLLLQRRTRSLVRSGLFLQRCFYLGKRNGRLEDLRS